MAKISGGAKLEAALANIARGLAGGGAVRVGFLENATYPRTSTRQLRATYSQRRKQRITGAVAGSPGGLPVAAVAAFQEYGTGTIPARPFFRNMIAAKSGEWPAAIARLLRAHNYDVGRVLDITGAAIAGQLKESIIKTNSPPLAASTIQRKGFAKPLIDTSHMINSIDHEVNLP